MISLISSSGETFETNVYSCLHCKTIANFIEEDAGVDCIPLPNVTSYVLDKILDFFNERLRLAREITISPTLESEDTLDDAQLHTLRYRSMTYLQENTTEVLLRVLTAANYLHCEILIDLISSVIASRLAGKGRDEMRAILGIENDFTEEEEAQVLAESAWAFFQN
jgi:S-phase kinase-associated protein 1